MASSSKSKSQKDKITCNLCSEEIGTREYFYVCRSCFDNCRRTRLPKICNQEYQKTNEPSKRKLSSDATIIASGPPWVDVVTPCHSKLDLCRQMYVCHGYPSQSPSVSASLSPQYLECLSARDCFKRLSFAEKLLWIIQGNEKVLDNILWTDEISFSSSDGTSFFAWCGITTRGTVGPYFFDNHPTGKSYLEMLRNCVCGELREKGYNLCNLWFQQDGASWHCCESVLQFLVCIFENRLISKGTLFVFPPRSQDLNPMNYFFWEHLKCKLNLGAKKNDVNFQSHFRGMLTKEVSIVSVDAIRNAIYQLPKRLELCLNMSGGRF